MPQISLNLFYIHMSWKLSTFIGLSSKFWKKIQIILSFAWLFRKFIGVFCSHAINQCLTKLSSFAFLYRNFEIFCICKFCKKILHVIRFNVISLKCYNLSFKLIIIWACISFRWPKISVLLNMTTGIHRFMW